ncbi:hypothetical protein LEP1GSC061_1176 [Leptospira wolffii serovar Khorat str. Khorat-H2]|nr:hypothetical protein LEP1GSC061_1176 [Leptospira wolffii serovar Khorat str. Khorat-H2]
MRKKMIPGNLIDLVQFSLSNRDTLYRRFSKEGQLGNVFVVGHTREPFALKQDGKTQKEPL